MNQNIINLSKTHAWNYDIQYNPQGCQDHVYVGETERTIQVRAKEHYMNFHLGYKGKSSVADHTMDMGHRIDQNPTRIGSEQHWQPRLVK